MNILKTSSVADIAPFLTKLYRSPDKSHKGQNGKLLIVGGSHLFHAASIWSAEIASHFVDMVHYASTDDNNEIVLSLKKIFRNGMVIDRGHMQAYIAEDDVVLLGPGMERTAETKKLTQKVLANNPNKRFVIDAGSLQMMELEWLQKLKEKPILTPHQKEFENLFNESIGDMDLKEKADIVRKKAYENNCVILLKAIVDIVSDGKDTYIIEGGNAGLTKGGTGDILAGLVTSFYTKNNPIQSCVIASYLLKRASDELNISHGSWYNNSDLINQIPMTLASFSFASREEDRTI